MKKLLSVVLALCFMLSVAPISAYAMGGTLITSVEITGVNTDLTAGKKVSFGAKLSGTSASQLEVYEEMWYPASSIKGDEESEFESSDISSLDKNAPTPVKGETYEYVIAFTLKGDNYISTSYDESPTVTINGESMYGYWWYDSQVAETSESEPETIVCFQPYFGYFGGSFRFKAVDEYIKSVTITGANIPLIAGSLPTFGAKVASPANKAELNEESIAYYENGPWWEQEQSFIFRSAEAAPISIADIPESEDISSSSYYGYSSDEEYNKELEEYGELLTTVKEGDKYYYGLELATTDVDKYAFSQNLSVTVNGKTYTEKDGIKIMTNQDVVLDSEEYVIGYDYDSLPRYNVAVVHIPVTAVKDTNTGWKKGSDGKWYYYENGVAAKGWKQVDGKWYYLDSSTGAMKQWYQTVNGKNYYFNSKGEMVTGWVKFNESGKWHYYKADGSEATGWFNDGKGWYYANAKGEMQNNMWIQKNSKWYYLTNSGKMATNMSIIYKGKTYKFDKNGVCLNP